MAQFVFLHAATPNNTPPTLLPHLLCPLSPSSSSSSAPCSSLSSLYAHLRMHISTTTPNPCQYSLDASNLPTMSIVNSFPLPTSQPRPSHLPSNPSVVPTYETRTLPPFGTSFQPAFAPPVAHMQHPTLHTTTWIPSSMTLLPNDSSSTPNIVPAGTPFQLPIITNVDTAQYHTTQPSPVNQTPSLYPTNICPSNKPILLSLPAVTPTGTVPSLPPISLPGTSNSFSQLVPSPTSVEPTPHTTSPTLRGKTPPTRKKRPSSTKRSRSKTAAPNTTKKLPSVSTPATQSFPQPTSYHPSATNPQTTSVRGQKNHPLRAVQEQRDGTPLTSEPFQSGVHPLKKAPAQTECMQSHSVPVTRNPSFPAPQLYQAVPGLNFADVVLQRPSYKTDTTQSRYKPWRAGLKAREKATYHRDCSTGTDSVIHRDVNGASHRSDVDPQLAPQMSVPQNTQPGTVVKRTTRSEVDGLPRKRAVVAKAKRSHVNRRTKSDGINKRVHDSVPSCIAKSTNISRPISASAVRQNREKLPSKSNTLRPEFPDTNNFGSESYGVNIAMSEWDGGVTVGKGNSSTRCNEENEENAVESLMTLAGSALTSNVEQERETVMNSKGAHLKTVRAPQGGDCGMQMDNNFGNFPNDKHLRCSAYQLARNNHSQHTYAPAIPGPSPSSVTDTPQAVQHRLSSARVPPEGTPTECTESTPVDIRGTRDMFTRTSTVSLTNAPRNHSLAQERLPLEKYLATSDQGREKMIPNPPHSSQDLASPLHRPSQTVRPLFHDRDFAQSPHTHPHNPPPPPPQSQSNSAVPQNHTHQPQRGQLMHPPVDLTQPFQQVYALNPSTNFAPHPPQFQSSGIVPTQSALPRDLQQVPDTSFEQPTMSPPRKPPAKTQNQRDLSRPAKRTKPTFKRSSTKTPKTGRPRQSKKKAVAPSPSGPNSASPLPSSDTNATAAPSLWSHGKFASNSSATPPITNSPPLSANNPHQAGAQELRSVEAEANANTVRNLSSRRPAQTGATTNGAIKPSHIPPADTAPATSKRTKTGNPKSRKASGSKSRASIEKALKVAAKAARSKQNSMRSVAKPPVAKSPKPQSVQQSQQVVNLRSLAPQDPLRPVSQPTVAAQVAFATSVQQDRTQKTVNMQAQENEWSQTTSKAPEDLIPARIQSEREAKTGSVILHTRVSPESTDEDHDASSPRTESTQQSLPPDISSAGPSDTENASNADDVPLAQTRKCVRSSPTSTPSPSDSRIRTIGPITQPPTKSQDIAQQKLTSVPTGPGSQTDKVLDRNAYPGTQGLEVEIHSTPSRKRQNSSKRTNVSKKRKRNPVSSSQRTSSMLKKKSQNDKDMPFVSEEATHGTVMDSQQDVLPPSNRIAIPKKPVVKGQTKSKVARQSTPFRKRASSSTKSQAKERMKRNVSQVKAARVRSSAYETSNLRLSLSVRERDDQAAIGGGAKRSGDSCGSPVTPDKHGDEFRYTSKSPSNAGSKVRKGFVGANKNCENQKTQEATPCFAEELKNLRASGILKANEGVSLPPSSGNPLCDVPDAQKILCVICQKRGSHSDMVKHPCFPVRAFDVCKPCAEVISNRVEEHGAKRKMAAVPSEESITQRTTLFVMLIEEMVTKFSPSDREHRDVEQIYEFIKSRKWAEMVERAESLSVHLDMLTVLRVALRKVGFTVRGGKLRWPAGEFILPAFADTRELVAHAVPARIDDLRKGILPGEAAWNETFLTNENLSKQLSSCAIYEKIFSLIGLRLIHVSDCSPSALSTIGCKVKFDAVSIGSLMYRTAVMLSGTVTRELLTPSWTKDEAFRFINETEVQLRNEPYEGTLEFCCICGCSNKPQNESCSFRFSNCSDCLRSFCSICLLNVLGTSEYLLSFDDRGYFCMMCRFQKNAELCPSGKPNRGEQDRRMRLHDLAGIRKRPERRIKSSAPLLLLSPSVRRDVLLRSELSETRKTLGVAKFCEVANDNGVRNAMRSQNGQALHDVCLECKLSVEGLEQDCSESEVLICGHEDCINIMHKACLAPQRQARRRGSRSKWSCPHHQCSKCEQRDELKLLRCRTCPTTFCKEHMPSPREVFLFSERSFACSRCTPFLRVPQLLRLKLQGSKSERKRNQFAQALAIGHRKRTAAVKKLSEGASCHEAATSSFNEFRRELEMK